MSELDYAIKLYNLATEEWSQGRAIKNPLPSDSDIKAVEDTLSFIFPPSFRRFLELCPYYGGLQPRAATYPLSIIWDNRIYHEESEDGFLPQFLVLFMGAHDGDCECFDSRLRDKNGEVPIVFWEYYEMTEDDTIDLQARYANFLEYLKFITDLKLTRPKLPRPK